MKTHTFTACITQEGRWFVAQCLEVDVASQGKSEDEAIDNRHSVHYLKVGACAS